MPNTDHFWYSELMAELLLREFKPHLNTCLLRLADSEEEVEVTYTHCHYQYIPNGGAKWPDTIYLGEGRVEKVYPDKFVPELLSEDYFEE